MRKIIVFLALLVFIAAVSLAPASTKMGSQEGVWISGKVVAIENGVLSLRESNGKIFKVAAQSGKLNGIKIGDKVSVKVVKGWVASIKKLGKKTAKDSTKLLHRQG